VYEPIMFEVVTDLLTALAIAALVESHDDVNVTT
jgi:hypothetical protein